MSIVWLDSFDHYTDVSQKYTASRNAEIVSDGGRFGTSGLYLTTSDWYEGYVSKTFASSGSMWTIGLAWMPTAIAAPTLTNVNNRIVRIGDTTGPYLYLKTDNTLGFATSSVNVLGGSTHIFRFNRFQYLELRVYLRTTATGYAKLWVDGKQWFDIENVALGLSQTDSIRVSGGGIPYIDDLYIMNGINDPVSERLEDTRVVAIYPNDDGIYQTWTPSTSGSHYPLVNEAPPLTSTYVKSGSSGSRESYPFDTLEDTLGQVRAMQLNLLANRGDDITTLNVSGLTVAGGSPYTNGNASLTTEPEFTSFIWETYPPNSTNWTATRINDSEFGMQPV